MNDEPVGHGVGDVLMDAVFFLAVSGGGRGSGEGGACGVGGEGAVTVHVLQAVCAVAADVAEVVQARVVDGLVVAEEIAQGDGDGIGIGGCAIGIGCLEVCQVGGGEVGEGACVVYLLAGHGLELVEVE